jgi:hypothetical protein
MLAMVETLEKMVASRNNNHNVPRIHKRYYFAAEKALFGVFLVDTGGL